VPDARFAFARPHGNRLFSLACLIAPTRHCLADFFTVPSVSLPLLPISGSTPVGCGAVLPTDDSEDYYSFCLAHYLAYYFGVLFGKWSFPFDLFNEVALPIVFSVSEFCLLTGIIVTLF